MTELITFLTDMSFYHWWGLGVILVIAEIFLPTTFLLWPALATLLVGLVLLIFPTLDPTWQWLGFAIFAVGLTVIGRRYFANVQVDLRYAGLNRRGSAYIGRHMVLKEDIEDGHGTIPIDDSLWRVRTVDGKGLKKGTEIEIIDSDGATLVIKA